MNTLAYFAFFVIDEEKGIVTLIKGINHRHKRIHRVLIGASCLPWFG